MIKDLDELKVKYTDILGTQSVTYKCDSMAEVVLEQLAKIPGVSVDTDTYGNIYAEKGKSDSYPAFACHIDTVHVIKDTFYYVITPDGFITALTTANGVLSQTGIGGDDKCGIIACLELLHRLPKVKCVFFRDEESGCKGSEQGNLAFFDNCRYVIQIDRKNAGDIITNGSSTELCSDDFIGMISALGETYNYKPTTGAMTDVVCLKKRGLGISVVNLSCGYYNPHHKDEYIVASELINCINFCIAISRIKTVYPHAYTPPPKYTPPPPVYRHTAVGGGGSPSKCLSCKKFLYGVEREEPVCDKCRKKLYAEKSVKLEVDGNTATLVVETTDNIADGTRMVVPQEWEDRLPANKCLNCMKERPLQEQFERDRGYCKNCGVCDELDCYEEITTFEGLIAGACQSHYLKITDAIEICLQCSEYQLVSMEERSRRQCNSCYNASHARAGI